jgi:hypothetical protein
MFQICCCLYCMCCLYCRCHTHSIERGVPVNAYGANASNRAAGPQALQVQLI